MTDRLARLGRLAATTWRLSGRAEKVALAGLVAASVIAIVGRALTVSLTLFAVLAVVIGLLAREAAAR